MAWLLVRGLVVGLVVAVPLAFAMDHASGPVARGRVLRFGQRQQLRITVANGGAVIRYLATTRRWRAAGLLSGYYVSVGAGVLDSRVTVNSLALFAGWFAGALVAEARVAHLGFAQRRAAALAERRVRTYLGRGARAYLPASVALAMVVAAVTGVAWLRGRPVDGPAALGWLAGAAAVLLLVALTGRVVLRRPQPVAEPDRLAADDAIRSRSLHVLAGGGGTLVLYCVLGQLRALQAGFPETDAITVVATLGLLLVPIAGYHVATLRWRVPRPPGADGAAVAARAGA